MVDARTARKRLREIGRVDLDREISRVAQRVATDYLRGVVRDSPGTPVDSGLSRANWQVTVDAKPSAPIAATDPTGSATVARELITIERLDQRRWRRLWFSNLVPYARYWEYGLYAVPGGPKTINGFSTQAPRGTMRINALRVNLRYARVRGGKIR